MTTIAFKDGRLAGDRMAWLGPYNPTHGRKRKVQRLDDGRLIGVSSCIVGASFALIDWVAAGAKQEERPTLQGGGKVDEFTIMMIPTDGRHIVYWNDGWLPAIVDHDYFAIGSGAQYALGAMASGCTAEGAVSIAARYDSLTQGGVDVVWLDGMGADG